MNINLIYQFIVFFSSDNNNTKLRINQKIIMKITIIFLIAVSVTQGISQKIFLTENESQVVFPHRYYQYLSTFSSQCLLNQTPIATMNKKFNTLFSTSFNNSHLLIASFPNQQISLYYTKLNEKGTLSVYYVDYGRVQWVFDVPIGLNWNGIVMAGKMEVVLWNIEQILWIEYHYDTRKITKLQFQWQKKQMKQASCTYRQSKGVICWNPKNITTIYQITRIQERLNVKQLYIDSKINQAIYLVQPFKENWLICFQQICIVYKQANKTLLSLKLLSVEPINNIFFSEHLQTLIIATGNSETTVIQYSLRNYNIVVLSTTQVIIGSQIQSMSADIRSVIIQTDNDTIVLLKDILHKGSQYLPFKFPIESGCMLSYLGQSILSLCPSFIQLNDINFYQVYINYHSSFSSQQIKIICNSSQEIETFEFSIISSKISDGYIDEQLPFSSKMSYNQQYYIYPHKLFKANGIVFYEVTQPFKERLKFQQNINYFSFYNQQICHQILYSSFYEFYRLLQITPSLYYIEVCNNQPLGFTCELYKIKENVTNMTLVVINNILSFVYWKGSLIFQHQSFQYCIDEYQGSQWEVYDVSAIVRLDSRGKKFFINLNNFVQKPFQRSYYQEKLKSSYFIQQYAIIETNFKTGEVNIYNSLHFNVLTQINSEILKIDQNKIFPYLVFYENFIFTFFQNHFTKHYIQQQKKLILIFNTSYNNQGYNISSFNLTNQFLAISHIEGLTIILNLENQLTGMFITVIEFEMLGSIMNHQGKFLLIPIQENNDFFVKINLVQLLAIGPFEPNYKSIYQNYEIIISVIISNGTCPDQQNSLFTIQQKFQLNITFDFLKEMQIGQSNISIWNLSQTCNSCKKIISEAKFRGPIFDYYLIDDWKGSFSLTDHFFLEKCPSIVVNSIEIYLREYPILENYDPVYDDNKLLITIGSQIVMVNEHGIIKKKFEIGIRDIMCYGFVEKQSIYFVLCDRWLFAIAGKFIKKQQHHQVISQYNSSSYQLYISTQSQKFNIFLGISNQKIQKYEYNQNTETFQFVKKVQITNNIRDLQIIDYYLFLIEQKSLCIWDNSNFTQISCLELRQMIPSRYAKTFKYESLFVYQFKQKEYRLFLLSSSSQNIHSVHNITIINQSITSSLVNAYAGYSFFRFESFLKIKLSQDREIVYFILKYEDINDESQVLVYYNSNQEFKSERIIGYFKSVLSITDQFVSSINFFRIVAVGQELWIIPTQFDKDNEPEKRVSDCLKLSINPQLNIIANYEQTPLLKFLIIGAKNIEHENHYYRLYFEEESYMLIGSIIGFAIVITSFVFFFFIEKKINKKLEQPFFYERAESENKQSYRQSQILSKQSKQDSYPLSD